MCVGNLLRHAFHIGPTGLVKPPHVSLRRLRDGARNRVETGGIRAEVLIKPALHRRDESRNAFRIIELTW